MSSCWRQLVLLGAALFFCPGCGSLSSHTQQDDRGKGPYSGVRADAWCLSHPNRIGDAVIGHVSPALVVPCCIIDLPLSAAVDTLLLPIDLTYNGSNAPGPIELDLREIRLADAVMSKTPDGPATVPVRLMLRNPRAKPVRLRTACLASIISCSAYTDDHERLWQFPRGGFGAKYDRAAVTALAARSETEIELALRPGRELLIPCPTGQGGPPAHLPAPASLRFQVRDSHVETESGAWIPITGKGTVSVLSR